MLRCCRSSVGAHLDVVHMLEKVAAFSSPVSHPRGKLGRATQPEARPLRRIDFPDVPTGLLVVSAFAIYRSIPH
jgi:hypothetical protein